MYISQSLNDECFCRCTDMQGFEPQQEMRLSDSLMIKNCIKRKMNANPYQQNKIKLNTVFFERTCS